MRSVAALIGSKRFTTHGVLTGAGLLLLPIGAFLFALSLADVLLAAGVAVLVLGVVFVLMGALSDSTTSPDRR